MTSIWLRPEGRQEQQLQALIDRFAEWNGTVAFAPHLTVCGVPGDLGVLDAAAAYVRECGLLPIRVAKTAVTGAVITPFRAVFIEVENSAELREFRERLREIVGARQLLPPHISLLYTLDRDTQAPRPDLFPPPRIEIGPRRTDDLDDTHVTLDTPAVTTTRAR